MRSVTFSILSGLTLGTGSWAIAPLVSDRFEPFDSDLGLYIGQSGLFAVAFYIGFSLGLRHVMAYFLGIYIAAIVYPYTFGTSESRAWASLALLTNSALCVFALLFGGSEKLMRIVKSRYKNRFKSTPRETCGDTSGVVTCLVHGQ